ncbi:MAG: hypothetical protein ACP5RI_02920 [Candidatus Micrarchaeia archaeon]
MGFAEPDNWMYYSAAIQYSTYFPLLSLHIPLLHSGFPSHNVMSEGFLLIWQIVILHFLLNISIYYAMLLLPLIYFCLGAILIYLVAKELTNSNFALFAVLLFAILPAVLIRTSSFEYRGESFVPILILFFIYLYYKFIPLFNINNTTNIIILTLLFFIILMMWKGALYFLAVFIFFFILLLLFYFFQNIKITISLGILLSLLLFIIAIKYFPIGYLSINNLYSLNIAEMQVPTLLTIFANYNFLFFLAPLAFIIPNYNKYDYKKKHLILFLFSLYLITIWLVFSAQRWAILGAIPTILLSVIVLFSIKEKINLANIKIGNIFIYIFIAFIIISLLLFDIIIFISSKPAAELDSYYLFLNWIKNNTPKNATFLTLWQDGSAIEGYANRSSYTDSVFGMNVIRMNEFAKFLFAKAGNFTYLTQIKPNYLIVREYWWNFTNGIAQEANLNLSNINLTQTNFYCLTKGKCVDKSLYNYSNNILYNVSTLIK